MRLFVRLSMTLPVLAGVVILTFLVTRLLPGDPVAHFAGTPGMTADDLVALRRDLGLDQSLWRQFLIYVQNLLSGDLGRSVSTGRPVSQEIGARLPASAELTLVAFVLAASVALPLGVVAALRQGGIVDMLCRVLATLGLSLPTFVTGLMLIHIFYFRLGWAPEPVGRIDPFLPLPPQITGLLLIDTAIAGDGQAWLSAAGRLALPAITMAIFAIGPLARIMRASMATALGQDFIRAARLNGLSRRQIIGTYAFRNALLPVVTMLAMTFSYMLGANVLVEKAFAWPGIGSFAVDALIALDHAPVQGFMLVMSMTFLAVNLAADLLHSAIDPRARRDD